MAKASGSIDLKSLKAAGEVASKYITTIDSNNGIQVHAQNNTAEHYVQINADGMEVFKDNDSKAFFGETVRIGRENQASITIDDSSIIGYGENGKEFFTFGNSTTTTSTGKRHEVLRLSYASSVPGPNNTLSPLTATLRTDPNSDNLKVVFKIVNDAGSSVTNSATFTKGTSSSKTVTINIVGTAYNFNVSYNGDKYFSNIKTTTSIPDTYKVAIYVEYSSDTTAPSYELGVNLSATGGYSYAEGINNTASGNYSHAEGSGTTASGGYSHAEGSGTTASGNYSHAEGSGTTASGGYSHAEGRDAKASGDYSHGEGFFSTASGNYSHAEGGKTTASGGYSHAEGFSSQTYSAFPDLSTNASGLGSHAEGFNAIASGDYSHSQNESTIAAKKAQTTLGTYNVEDTSSTTTHSSGTTAYGQYAVIIGNGTTRNNRSNALTVDWSGNVEAAGEIRGATSKTVITTFSSGWDVYDTSTSSPITLRRCGKFVELTGQITNTAAVTLSSTQVTIFTIPEGYRPSQTMTILSQGSSMNVFVIRIKASGEVTFERYRSTNSTSTSYLSISEGAWFPIHAAWIMD